MAGIPPLTGRCLLRFDRKSVISYSATESAGSQPVRLPFGTERDYEEPYSSDIKSLAKSCSQPFVCKPRWASGGLTNRIWFADHISSCNQRPGLVLCFSGSADVVVEARSLGVPIGGCFSKNPKKGVLAAAYCATLLRGLACHRG
eukprot:12935241-Prorocentrum_lima.AAC.1